MTTPDNTLLSHAYGRRLEVTLPNGKPLVAKPLDFEKALEFLDLLDEAQESKSLRAVRQIAKEFPEVIEAGNQLKGLTMVELFDVVRFFITSRPIGSSTTSSDRTGMETSGEKSPSEISSPITPPPTEDRQSLASPGPSSSSSPERPDESSPGNSTL